MRKLFPALFLLLVSLPAFAAAQPITGFVHTQGQQLVDAQGKPLHLRGINLGNWFEPEGYMFHFKGGPQAPREIYDLTKSLLGPEQSKVFWQKYREAYITQKDIQFLKRAGFNSVRVPIDYEFFTTNNSAGFQLLDHLISWCRKAGIYVVIDMHDAPGGQTGANIDNGWNYPWLYSSPEAQDELVSVWTRIASRYKDNPAVLGYDLLNEPIANYPSYEKFNKDLEPVYKKVAAGIRTVDTHHVLIMGGAQWDTNFTVFGPPFDSNSMYTFHAYWMPPVQASIQKYIDFGAKNNVPMWLGESGENTDAWIAQFISTLNANHIGWCFWPYKKMDATSSVVSFPRPPHWDEIVAYAKLPQGTGNSKTLAAARPPQADIDAAFAALLKDVRYSHENVNAGYLKALGLKVPAHN
jgi:aryl-phospho-beta-D-glucosidase BglC (GH1 family)